MAYLNNAHIIKHDLIAKLAALMKNGRITEDVDRIPLEISPREKGATRRCCIYKERAVARYKLMPLLGFSVEEEVDELTSLAEYAAIALRRKKPESKSLSVVDEACTSCVKANYVVSNLCKGCVARSCQTVCPKDAVSKLPNGQAFIDSSKCVNCGKCQKVCPYHSIIYVPVPCEEVCPVKAITKDEHGIEHIDDSKCTSCGRCINACPFGSIYEHSQMIDVLKRIRKGKKLTAMLAPSISGQYDLPLGKIVTALKMLGFDQVMEVAEGAMITTRNEGLELQEKLEEGQTFMTTSCCPAYVEFVDKHAEVLKPFVSDTLSPMAYTAQLSKERNPENETVFIGPCVAKRKEAFKDENVDMILTFEEIAAILDGWDIFPEGLYETTLDNSQDLTDGVGFALSGGVAGAVKNMYPDIDIDHVEINGLDKKSIGLLKSFVKRPKGNFVEVMACEGGCIGGPSAHVNCSVGARNFKKQK